MAHEDTPLNKQETKPERIPNEREVLDIIKSYEQHGEIFRKREDEKGLYLLEVRVPDKENSNNYVQYEYMRKDYAEGSARRTAVLAIVYYEDNEAIGAEDLAIVVSETGEWKKFS